VSEPLETEKGGGFAACCSGPSSRNGFCVRGKTESGNYCGFRPTTISTISPFRSGLARAGASIPIMPSALWIGWACLGGAVADQTCITNPSLEAPSGTKVVPPLLPSSYPALKRRDFSSLTSCKTSASCSPIATTTLPFGASFTSRRNISFCSAVIVRNFCRSFKASVSYLAALASSLASCVSVLSAFIALSVSPVSTRAATPPQRPLSAMNHQPSRANTTLPFSHPRFPLMSCLNSPSSLRPITNPTRQAASDNQGAEPKNQSILGLCAWVLLLVFSVYKVGVRNGRLYEREVATRDKSQP
jgi:hypothetical protein